MDNSKEFLELAFGKKYGKYPICISTVVSPIVLGCLFFTVKDFNLISVDDEVFGFSRDIFYSK